MTNPTETTNTIESVIGVCCDTLTSPPTWHWIDSNGNKVNHFNYQSYPTFAKAKMVTFDADRGAPALMTAIPKFYIKTAASGPAGTFAEDKKCLWISHTEVEGFRPHAAFKRNINRSISDWCYLGTFMGYEETIGDVVTVGSADLQQIQNSLSFDDFKSRVEARNQAVSATSQPYRMMDVWDMGLIKLLALIAKAGGDTQRFWGRGKNTQPITGSTQARIVFKGSQTSPTVWIDDLWESYNCYIAGLVSDNMVFSVTSPMDGVTTLKYDDTDKNRYTGSAAYGFITDILDCPLTIGDDTHDLMELFLPKATSRNKNESPFADYFNGDGGRIVWANGGYWEEGDFAGLFRLNYFNYEDESDLVGGRLAR